MKTPKCLGLIRAYIHNHRGSACISVEETAEKLNLKQKDVSQCFHILNLEGKMSQGDNPWHHRVWHYADWCRTTYMAYDLEMEGICLRCKIEKICDKSDGWCQECLDNYHGNNDVVHQILGDKEW